MTFKAELKASLGWNWNEGAADNGRLDYAKAFPDGNGDGQAEAVWHCDHQTLPGGGSLTLDLTALTRTVLGDTLTTTLLTVTGLMVFNESATAGRLVLGASGGAEWPGPLGADGDTIAVPPDGALVLAHRQGGWPVDDSHKLLKLAAVGDAVTYSIALLGTLTAGGSGSSGA